MHSASYCSICAAQWCTYPAFPCCSKRCATLPMLLHAFTSVFYSTDQELAYLHHRDLSVSTAELLLVITYTSSTNFILLPRTSYSIVVQLYSTIYYFCLCFHISVTHLLLIHLAGYLLCRETPMRTPLRRWVIVLFAFPHLVFSDVFTPS